jgi:hypothetical protein
MAFEVQALIELRPGAKFKASEFADGTFSLEWNPEKNGGEAAPTMDEINAKASQIKTEIPIRHLRKERDLLLAESDWTQIPDVPEAVKTAWQTYRQELRDLPANTSDPENPIWPTKPS